MSARRRRLIRLGAIGWFPSVLFSQGDEGVWYDSLALSTLSQDDAGMTPVDSAGDNVGREADKSGNDNHATQSVSDARPTYPGLVYDGANDALSSDYPATDVMGEFTISAAIRLRDLGVSDGYFFAMGSSSSTVPIFGINANNSRGITFVVRRDDGTVWQPTGIPLDTDYHVATCIIGSGSVEFFVDGASVASTTSGGSLTVDQVAMGALPRPTNVAHLNAEVAGGVCLSRAVTPSERASLENYLAGKVGLAL